MTLLPQIAEAVSIPVIGSGGIADGRGMAAAISLGAEGIEMGTAFLCSEECTIHENAKNAIINQQDYESVVTFGSIGEPCRQIRNKLANEVLELEENNPVKSVEAELRKKFAPCLKDGMHEGDTERGAIMSGMVAPLIKEKRLVNAFCRHRLFQREVSATFGSCSQPLKLWLRLGSVQRPHNGAYQTRQAHKLAFVCVLK